MALVENIQREDLDSIEVAISYQRLIDEVAQNIQAFWRGEPRNRLV